MFPPRPPVALLLLSGLLPLLSCTADQPASAPAFDGPSEPVEIRVDDLGIPHIYGANDADTCFGAGYQMATDRLFEMDLTRRRAEGTRSEVLGEGRLGDDQLARLIDFPRWGRQDAGQLLARSRDDYLLVAAWVAGVNRRIEEVRAGDAPLPYGFGPDELDYMPEPWTVEDALTVAVLLGFGNDETLQNELLTSVLRKQFPEFLEAVQLLKPAHAVYGVPEEDRPHATAAHLPAATLPRATEATDLTPTEIAAALDRFEEVTSGLDVFGSNNWAVSGSLTDNGRPLIAGDPHQPLDSPSLFYVQHLNSADRGGTLDVMGWSFVGAPAVHIGHNRHVAWTATSNYGDVVDIWEVQRAGTDAIRLGDEELPVHEREETIRVRQRNDAGELTDEWEDIRYVVKDVGDGYGVLLDDSILPASLVTLNGGLLMVKWTGFDGTAMSSGWIGMNRAKSVDEFEDAVLGLRSGSFNFIAADEDDILYRVGLDVPDRGDPSARPMPWMVADGDDPGTVWTGEMLSPDQLPHARNPTRGWLATANNDPWGFTDDGIVENDPWYYGSFYAVGFRAERISDELERLAARGDVTVDDMTALQLDTHSVMADDLLPLLEEAWTHAQTDDSLAEYRDRDDLATLMDLLSGWDRQMRRDAAAPVPFHIFALLTTSSIVGDDLDFIFDQVFNSSTTYVIKVAINALYDRYERSDEILEDDRDSVLLEALADTADLLTDRFGGVDPSLYTWADVHGTHFDNTYGGRLEYGFIPTDGGEDTVNVSGSKFIRGGRIADRFESGGGPIYRMVASFDDDGTPRAIAHFPIGNSGDPDSPHWDDMVEDWANGVYHPMPFRRADVEAATEEVITLSP